MTVVFTDLDGTLLDEETYSFEEARPALDALAERGIPCVFVTSKTRAEVEPLRRQIGNHEPFVVENGGAIHIPVEGGGYTSMRLGTRYDILTGALMRASAETECPVRAFHQLSGEEVAELCGLPLDQARLAKQREHDEPFVILDPEKEGALLAALERRGVACTKGGRFHHAFGGNDKGRAVEILTGEFRRRLGDIRTIGLGDGQNDRPFLEITDIAVAVRNSRGQCVPLERRDVIRTEEPGPRGWNRAILDLIAQ